MQFQVPELLAPAGNFDKLKVAVHYGANAVYLAGQQFGLRSAADNFTPHELEKAVNFAHTHGVKVYVTLNSFLYDHDMSDLRSFLEFLKKIRVDAAIISDMGIAKILQDVGGISLHVSTQASVNNASAAAMWKKLGATRLILGREVSIEEASIIKKDTNLEVEIFVHGSMCMAYSGHCVISNYTQGRDSNRGGCAHSCRFEYQLETDQGKVQSHFMSSKDLNGLFLIEPMAKAGIDSIKVEGRMKSELYAASTTKTYSTALKMYKERGVISAEKLKELSLDLDKIPHRAYTQASLLQPAGEESIFDERDGVKSGEGLAAQVVHSSEQMGTVLAIRKAFNVGDTLEFVPFHGPNQYVQVNAMWDMQGSEIQRTKPSTLVKIPFKQFAQNLNLVRVLV